MLNLKQEISHYYNRYDALAEVSPKAVLFDWDDTLIDSWDRLCLAINKTLIAMGTQPWSAEEAHQRLGPSAKDLFQGLYGDQWQKADQLFYDFICDETTLKSIKVREGAVRLLQALKDSGVYVSVVSNKRGKLLRQEVEYLGWEHFFSNVIGAGDAKFDKPDVSPVHLALKDTGIIPQDECVWFVGDSPTDMICAYNAYCLPVLVEYKKPPENLLQECRPALSFENCLKILSFLQKKHFFN